MEDNRKRFLDKVVEFLVKDTKVDYDNRRLFFPFTYKRSLRQGSNNLTPFHKLLFDTYIPMDGFMEYIEEMYGITSRDEIDYVWETYKVIMNNIVFGKDTSPLYFNESIEGKDKILLDRILKYLIDDTIVDHDNGKVTFPFFLKVLPSMPNEYWFNVNSTSSLSFSQYCKYTYGLNDDEVIYLYSKYKELFSDKVYGRNSINESDDKKQEYLNKVVNWLVRDTEISNEYWFSPPYYPGSMAGRTGFRSVYEHTLKVSNYSTYEHFDSGLASQLIYFKPYCLNNYGLTEDEIDYVWKGYMEKLYESNNWGF